MITTSKPINTPTIYLKIDSQETKELIKIIENYIDWDVQEELYINLSNLEPIIFLNKTESSTYDYLKALLIPNTMITSHYYSPSQLLDFIKEYGGEFKNGTRLYEGIITTFPSDLMIRLSDARVSADGDWVIRPYDGYTRYMFLKYWIEEVQKRHKDMWGKMNNITLSHIFQDYYNLTSFDLRVFCAIDLSHEIHPDESCVFITNQVLLDLKSIGFSCGVAHFNEKSALSGHQSPAPWVSKLFIDSQIKFKGPLSSSNFIPWGSTGIERFNIKGAKESRWTTIIIDPLNYYGPSEVVYNFEPDLNLSSLPVKSDLLMPHYKISLPKDQLISSLSLSKDGTKIAIGIENPTSNKTTLAVYSLETRNIIWQYDLTYFDPNYPFYIKKISWGTNNQIAVSLGWWCKNNIFILSNEGKLLCQIDLRQTKEWDHPMMVLSMDWSPDDELAVVGHIFTSKRETEEDIIVIFNSTGNEVSRTRIPVGRSLDAVVKWSPNGSYIAFSNYLCTIMLSKDGIPIWNKTNSIVIKSITWSPNEEYFVLGRWNELAIFSYYGDEVFNCEVQGFVWDLTSSTNGDIFVTYIRSNIVIYEWNGKAIYFFPYKEDKIRYIDSDFVDLLCLNGELIYAKITSESTVDFYKLDIS